MLLFSIFPQIVRADLKELVNLDLGGAPYGYTPFCDSRQEMEGFRWEIYVPAYKLSKQRKNNYLYR